MNEQLFFDTAVDFIRKQGVPSVDETGECAYFGERGMGCAFSVALADGVEPSDVEDIAADALLDEERTHLLKAEFRSLDKGLAERVQAAHDDAHLDLEEAGNYMLGFEENMKTVAEEFGLNYRPPA